MFRTLSLLLVFILLFSCQNQGPTAPPTSQTTSESSLKWQEIANQLLEQMDLQEGEKVLLVGQAGDFDPLIPLLRQGIVATGAEDLGAINVDGANPQSWSTDFTREAVGKSIEELEDYLSEVDLGLMLPGAVPAHPPYAALQNILEEGQRRTIHFHWSGAYHLNGLERPVDSLVNQFYQWVLLKTDYEQLATNQEAFEEAMRGQQIRVTTPAGTDIRFEIGDRPVTKQDGNASAVRALKGLNLIDREVELPAGAIRVAPIESSVNGSIAFPDGQWNGEGVKGLIMSFEAGKLITFDAQEGNEAVQAEIEQAGDAGRAFREFALGFNPLLSIEQAGGDWIPYYGYGAGVVRLSLGDNTELGGQVGGGYVRWNFFADATVQVGKTVWVKDGKLIL